MNIFPVRFDRLHERIRPFKTTPSFRSPEEEVNNDQIPMILRHGRILLALEESQLNRWQDREQLAFRLNQVLDDPKVRVLRIDMSGIRWLDGDVLAEFARIHCKASCLGKQIILENVCDEIREIFHVTRFDRMVGLVDERGERNLAGWSADTTFVTQVRS